jgi:hypothetical protein
MRTLLTLCLKWAKWRLSVAERYDREMFRLYQEADLVGNGQVWFRRNASAKYERWVGRCKRRVARLESWLRTAANPTALAC